jgi:hypothetical protein
MADSDEVTSKLLVLSNLVTALAENPSNELLHYKNIALSEQLGLSQDELETARDTLVSFFPARDGKPKIGNLRDFGGF